MMNSTSSNRIAEKVAARFGIPVKDIGNDPVASQVLNRVMLTMSNKYAEGGAVPRQTTIEGQPHALAYINPEEEQMRRNAVAQDSPVPVVYLLFLLCTALVVKEGRLSLKR